MLWLILTQLIVLSFLSYHSGKWKAPSALRLSWRWFSGVFFSQALLTVFRAGCFRDQDFPLVEIWADGFTWFFIGMSILQLSNLFFEEDHKAPRL